MADIFTTMKISSSAMAAQRTRLNVISANVANVETTRTPEGGPYRRQEVVFRTAQEGFASNLERALRDSVQGVEVAEVRASDEPPRQIYDPGHPDADGQGMVAMPNVDILEEMVDMMTAAKAYEANVTVIKSAKRMALKALEIGR
ncbi:MAG: flagellar basal body rod protein FlgC [Trichloromonadaceae bacterium]